MVRAVVGGRTRCERAQVDELDGDAVLLTGEVRRLLQHAQLRAPPHHGDVRALAHDVRLAQLDGEVAHGHLAHARAVHRLGLEENNRVRVADRREQQALRLARVARNHDFQTRSVAEISLGRLRVVETAVAHSAVGRADRQAADVELVAAAVAVLGCLVDDLVKRREDVVCELNLRDGRVAHSGHSDGEADHSLLGQRRVEHAVRTVLLAKVNRRAEHTAEGNILTENNSLKIKVAAERKHKRARKDTARQQPQDDECAWDVGCCAAIRASLPAASHTSTCMLQRAHASAPRV